MTQQEISEIKQTIRLTLIELLSAPDVSKIDASRILKISIRTLHRWVGNGKIKENERGRIDRTELVRLGGSL
jgi:transposase-like protein